MKTRTDEKIHDLEVSREIVKRKLEKLFDESELIEKKLYETGDAINKISNQVEILTSKIDNQVDRLIIIEQKVASLEECSHSHRVIF